MTRLVNGCANVTTGEKIEAADWRYMFSMVCMDHSDEYWVSVFGDKGDKIFGISAAEMKEIYDREPERYENMISDALFNDYSLRVKVAVDNYTDVPRAKGSLVEIERVNYVDMSKKLIGKIAKLHAGEEPEVYVPPTKKRASDVGYGQENKMPAFNGGWNQAGGQANGGGASAANAAKQLATSAVRPVILRQPARAVAAAAAVRRTTNSMATAAVAASTTTLRRRALATSAAERDTGRATVRTRPTWATATAVINRCTTATATVAAATATVVAATVAAAAATAAAAAATAAAGGGYGGGGYGGGGF